MDDLTNKRDAILSRIGVLKEERASAMASLQSLAGSLHALSAVWRLLPDAIRSLLSPFLEKA